MMLKSSPRRPLWFIGILLILALIELGAAVKALQIPQDVAGTLSLPPLAQFVLALVWGGVFLWAAIGLLRRNPGGARRGFWALVVFIAYSALRLFIFAQSDYDRGRLPLLMAATALCGVLLIGTRAGVQRMRRRGSYKHETMERTNR